MRVGQDDARRVDAELIPRRRRERRPEKRRAMLVEHVQPGHSAVRVDLLDLVAVDGVVEEEGEVGKEIELVVLPVAVDLQGVVVGHAPADVEVAVEAQRIPAFAVVDRSEAGDESLADRSRGDLPRGEPVAVEVRGPHGPVDVVERGGHLRENIEPEVVLIAHERAVGRIDLHREERLHLLARGGEKREIALGSPASACRQHEVLGHDVERDEIDGAGGGEVPELHEVRALVRVHLLECLRNQEVQVGVSLAVRVRAEVHG